MHALPPERSAGTLPSATFCECRARAAQIVADLRRLPPSADGEWWEMMDEQSGLPYYYHTKTGETVWERPPQAFVIPLRVLQVRSRSSYSVSV